MYNVEQYSDEECFRILSLKDSPNDETLEQKIIEYRDKYTNQKTEKTRALYNFFSDMYDRFFENIKEGFQTMPPPTQVMNGRLDENGDGNVDLSDIVQSENMKSIFEYDTANKLTVTRDIQYFKGQLNPLLKETIRRTININSSDRDKVFDQMHTLTTDFNFSLEETLKNVVSLKLYSVQVPFTWYTIDDAFGSNIIYLKSDSLGLQGSIHQYYFSILPGNYDSAALAGAVNTSLQTLKIENPMVNFGNTCLSYNYLNTRATFQLDIQKIYDTQEFKIDFENDPNDNSYNNLATFLCFSNKSNIEFKADISKNYLITTRKEVTSNTLGSILVLRYSAHFDVSGKMMDISSHLVKQNIINNSKLHNEETILQIDIDPSLGTDGILAKINNMLKYSENLSLSRVYDISGKIHWDINFDKDIRYPLINQKMALKITGTDTSFGFSFPSFPYPKYVDIDGLPYRYVIESNSQFVPPNRYDMSGLRVVVLNNTVRNNSSTYSEANFLKTVDLSFSLTVSNNLVITDLMENITNQFRSHREFSIGGEKVVTGSETKYTVDVSINKNYYGIDFLNDLSFSTNPGIDFSGVLYDVFLFRNPSVDISSITISGSPESRTKLTITNSGEFVYTSYHPNLTNTAEYKNTTDVRTITIAGKNTFPDFSMNIDIKVGALDGISTTGSVLNKLNTVISDKRQKFAGLYFTLTLTTITASEDSSDISYAKAIFNREIPSENSNYFGDTKIQKTTLTITMSRKFSTTDYSIYFISDNLSNNNNNVWVSALKLDSSYNLSISGGRIGGGTIDTSNKYKGQSKKITISTIGKSEIHGFPEIIFTVPNNPEGYQLYELIDAINKLLTANIHTYGSYFQLIDNKVSGFINITKIYTTQDYNLVFYDEKSFESCNKSTNYFRTAKSNTTLGYILGFRSNTEFMLGSMSLYLFNYVTYVEIYDEYDIRLIVNVLVTLTGDTVVSVSLYNKLFIVLEDYNQNHMNDGLVSVSQRDTRASLPVYALRNIYNCNPETNETMNQGLNGKHLTNRQIYSMNQIIEEQSQPSNANKGTQSLKDVFAIVPIKYGLNPGDIFVEFGGTLQIQERSYFGPVNISRLRVKLLTDRGDVINLNNADWSFQIICEQLWQNIK
jgi:hypothetical protein